MRGITATYTSHYKYDLLPEGQHAMYAVDDSNTHTPHYKNGLLPEEQHAMNAVDDSNIPINLQKFKAHIQFGKTTEKT